MLSCIVLVVLLMVFVLYDNLYFRLKSTTPPMGQFADSSVQISYHFSQPIKSVGAVKINNNTVNDVVIDGSVVTVPLEFDLEKDVKYSIEIQSIESDWFGNKIELIKRSFTPQYIDFNKLSDEERKVQVDASNSGQVDDPFIDDNVFPIFNGRWQIDATVITDNRSVVLNVKFFEEVPDYDNGGASQQVSNEVAEKYRKQVLNEIKKRGADPKDYTIVYSNQYLHEKYTQHPTH